MLACSYIGSLLGNLPQMSCQRIATRLEKKPKSWFASCCRKKKGLEYILTRASSPVGTGGSDQRLSLAILGATTISWPGRTER
jgi:hypothetical protein